MIEKSIFKDGANKNLTHPKNENGITLIALVITIIVLLILAGISINMLSGQDGILTKASQAKELTGIAEISDGIKQAYLTAKVEGEGKITESLLQEALNDQFGSEKAAGSITMSNGRISAVTIDGISVEFGESVKAKKWTLPEGDTEVNVGELLTPTVDGLENEKFYVIADDGTTLTLLAERCINTSSNTQVSSDYSKPVFDDDSNVYNGSTIQGLVNAYVGTLTGLDLEDVEVAYNTDPVTGVKGRLMWYEETEDTTFKEATNYSDMLYGPSTARINFWLGSADIAYSVWNVVGEFSTLTSVDFNNVNFYGVRPVIKILKSSVE